MVHALIYESISTKIVSSIDILHVTSYKARLMRVHIINPILPRLLWGFLCFPVLDTSSRKCPNLFHFVSGVPCYSNLAKSIYILILNNATVTNYLILSLQTVFVINSY